MSDLNLNVIDRFGNLMDRNIKGVEYGVYTVAGIGFLLAMRSVRPFKKFRRAADIPRHFIDKRMTFNGKVVGVQGGKKPTLYIDHFPVVPLPLRSEGPLLPVQISSVDVTPNGGIWLNTMLLNEKVSFTPLVGDGTVVQSIVHSGKRNVGEHLVSIGFATASPFDLSLDKDAIYSRYYKSLLSAEKRAERSGAGLWQDQKVMGIFQKVLSKFYNVRYSVA